MATRSSIVETARAYLGVREGTDEHKFIINTYNAHTPLARGHKVTYTDAWCATFVSFLGIVNGCTDIMPTECGVSELIRLYQKIGRYTGASRVPEPGDVLFFTWSHVGIVETVEGGMITTIEGNKNDMVARRTVEVSDTATIRGYGVPAYTEIEEMTSKALIDQVAHVCKEAQTGHWTYGHSTTKPPCADRKIACDRMISRALWELGFTDQRAGGETSPTFESYFIKHGWHKIKAPEYCQDGDAVFIMRPGVLHMFLIEHFRSVNDIDKYDLGSQDRINRGGHFTHVKFNEWPDGHFAGAWRCSDAVKEPTSVDIPDGTYEIKSALDSRYVLDVAGGSMASGANIWIYQGNGSRAQQFKITKNADGKTYSIRNSGSRLALDVEGGSRTNGTNIWQYAPNGTDAQKWIIAQDGNGFIFWNKAARKCMDVTGGRVRSGTNVWSYSRNGSAAQRWYLKPVDVPPAAEIEEGIHFIRSAANGSYCIDITGGSKQSGANVWLWEFNGSKAQQFDFKRNADGSYTITNVGSGLALDVLGGLSAEYTNVQQYRSNNTDAQKWVVTRNENGSYSLFNKGAGKMLDIAGGKIADGTNIWSVRDNGTKAQQWCID